MPRFPAQQSEMVSLAEAMISGYTEHPALFPKGDPAELQAVLDAYKRAAAARDAAVAKAKSATEAKQAALKRLNAGLRLQIKRSRIDTADDRERLKLIGWGPRGTKLALNPYELRRVAHELRGVRPVP